MTGCPSPPALFICCLLVQYKVDGEGEKGHGATACPPLSDLCALGWAGINAAAMRADSSMAPGPGAHLHRTWDTAAEQLEQGAVPTWTAAGQDAQVPEPDWCTITVLMRRGERGKGVCPREG